MKTVLGDSHEDTLAAGYKYSSVLLHLNRIAEAQEILNNTYNKMAIVHGKFSVQAKTLKQCH